MKNKNSRLRVAAPSKSISGAIQLTRKGVGYLVFENQENIEIKNVNLPGAFIVATLVSASVLFQI